MSEVQAIVREVGVILEKQNKTTLDAMTGMLERAEAKQFALDVTGSEMRRVFLAEAVKVEARAADLGKERAAFEANAELPEQAKAHNRTALNRAIDHLVDHAQWLRFYAAHTPEARTFRVTPGELRMMTSSAHLVGG